MLLQPRHLYAEKREVTANFLNKLQNITIYWITVMREWSRVLAFKNLMVLYCVRQFWLYFILNLNFAKLKYLEILNKNAKDLCYI